MTPIQQQTLALAGIFQACNQVNDIANRGLTRQESTIASLSSVLTTQANDLNTAIGTPKQIRYGLQILIDVFDGDRDYLDALQYTVAISQLQQAFSKDKNSQNAVAQGLQLIERMLPLDNDGEIDSHHIIAPEIISQVADIWTENIHKLQPQIIVQGKPVYLQNGDNVYLIRALLMAALRCAWLWQQVGGRRWHLIFKRSALKQAAQKLLSS